MNVILITFVNITSSARIFGWRKTNKQKKRTLEPQSAELD